MAGVIDTNLLLYAAKGKHWDLLRQVLSEINEDLEFGSLLFCSRTAPDQ